MGVDRLRERVGRSIKKAEGIGAHGMSAAALGSRGEALARGSVEGCRAAALYRGFRGEKPRGEVEASTGIEESPVHQHSYAVMRQPRATWKREVG